MPGYRPSEVLLTRKRWIVRAGYPTAFLIEMSCRCDWAMDAWARRGKLLFALAWDRQLEKQ
jgi:hypothetical protein